MRSLTPRIVGEILSHEGLVRESYRDSQGVWTWSVGITDASGHRVARYRDNPQPLERCLEVFLWLLTARYLPAVLKAFGSHEPAEHELAAALSFHYNTGGIARAEWLRRFLADEREAARRAFLAWSRPPEIAPRRRRERDLLFDGAWSGDGRCMIYEVAKPSYQPVKGRRIEVAATLTRLMGELGPDAPARAEQPAAPEPPNRNWFDRLFD